MLTCWKMECFFLFLHKACWILLFVSFSCRIRPCFCLCHVHFLQQTISHMCKCFTKWVHCVGRMNVWILHGVNIGVLTGWNKIKQRRISFVLSYLRTILWKISTTISIKHRILATVNIKKVQFWQPVCL
jgi:hypothetical protein